MPEIPQFNVVTRHNLVTMQLALRHVLDRAHHIAIDCEFTGLGANKHTKASNIEERYKALVEVASTHAIVSFGLSVFELNDTAADISADTAGRANQYTVHNFEFLMLSKTAFTVAPDSMIFLVDNGFDFNRQYADGIFYQPGNDVEGEDGSDTNFVMRSIFLHMLSRNVPIVVHNGLLDLLFIYHSFYADLPKTLENFVADVTDMFPAGIYDTKYVSDYVDKEKASYLAYLFRKYEREQAARQEIGEGNYLMCSIKDRMATTHKEWKPLPVAPKDGKRKRKAYPDTGKPYCEQYAAHGYCINGRYCLRSHDLDIILDMEQEEAGVAGSKKRRKKDSTSALKGAQEASKHTAKPGPGEQSTSMETTLITTRYQPQHRPDISKPPASRFENYHSACFDAKTRITWQQVVPHGKADASADPEEQVC
ncbi:hypothetical protein PhCBS80983_g05195 [Powellomyces hirtus]|uniref:C3H1-type domain-containing protein n=1 Tax=Powellomyces hirtus TaxID=109895 RepID=A0A507DXI7_9FUNG|nr:hypothetical protein PhCBS80983_g05195 [Powellomyces hirtus]